MCLIRSALQKIAETFAANSDAQLVGSAVDDIDADGAIIARSVRALPEHVDQRWFLRRGRLTDGGRRIDGNPARTC